LIVLVDIPAHSYQLSFESSVNWTKFYAGAPEILEYWKKVVDKYDIRKLIKLKHKCIEARWNEETSKWHVKLEIVGTGEIVEDTGDVFMVGTGALNDWKWPDIKGLHDFKGKILHSANWDSSYDATGEKIAVIGAGSSGIQIVPALQPKVKAMDHYVRGRTWIASTFGNELVRSRNNGQDGNFEYTQEEIETWTKDPDAYIKYRKALEVGMQGGFAVTHRGTKEHEDAWVAFNADMKKRLEKKKEIAEHLIPEFPPLCKRLTPGPGYLEALVEDNVAVIPTRISHVDATGITTTDGVHRAVDSIICATGFDTSYRGRFPIYGRGGVNLRERYNKRQETYLSLAVDDFPNFFQSLGPNAGLGNGSLLVVIEAVCLYVAQILEKMAKGNVKTIEPKQKAVQNFTNYCDAFFKRTVFSAECGSWYKSAPPNATEEERKQGRVTALWPGSSIHAARTLEKVRFEDFEMTTVDDNEFGWIGDGWSAAERANDAEGLSWYINNTTFTHHPLKNEKPLQVENGKVVSNEEDGTKKDEIVSEYSIPNGVVAT
jgi:cation diffusion facilitator CzcD-associated flavoprotein CzcO